MACGTISNPADGGDEYLRPGQSPLTVMKITIAATDQPKPEQEAKARS
jgi:hypothetical protein